MSRITVIKNYNIAENDRGNILVSFPDQSADVQSAVYTLHEGHLVLVYNDGRKIKLPQIPVALQPVIQTNQKILVAEVTATGLARTYEIRNIVQPPVKRTRARL